ncbi:MAG: riboflavin synthase [Elusimicrobiota bacterium]|mgnify:CR=1 FL=1
MFTGIIEFLGRVEGKTPTTLTVAAKVKPTLGASIAVNGCCLTVVETKNGRHRFDVGPETWNRTSLGQLRVGQSVNIEPSLRMGGEVGGHFVTGHVDAAARILGLVPWGKGFWRLRMELPPALRGLVAEKGSIAVDGISLTVTGVTDKDLEIMLVPHTLENTNLGRRKAGDRVNLEADPLARYAFAAAAALKNHRRKREPPMTVQEPKS